MTKEEIIKMARQAGFERLGHDEHDYVCYPDDIVAFAKLVAEHEPVAKNEGGHITWLVDDWPQNCLLYTHPLVPTAQPEQEPVAWAMLHDNGHFIDAIHPDEHLRVESEYTHPLYTTPPQRKPLSDEEIEDLYFDKFSMGELKAFARAIEAAHGIKENT